MAFLAFSCEQQPQDRVYSLIKSGYKSAMHDPSSYECLEISRPDSVMTRLDFDKKYNSLEWKIRDLESDKWDKTFDLRHNRRKERAVAKLYDDSIKMYKDSLEAYKKAYQPTLWGWKVEHIYRAKNAFGAKIIAMDEVYFDPDFTKIVDINSVQ